MKALTTTLIIVLLSQCSKFDLWKDDELSINRMPFSGDELRIDGYYSEYTPNIEWTRVFFLYSNGIVLESYIENKSNQFEKVNKYSKTRFGVFYINNTEILFEKWYPGSGGGLPAYVRSGHILNDTTFVVTESYRMKKGKKTEVEQRNETYHFRQFSPKPDSTNVFVP